MVQGQLDDNTEFGDLLELQEQIRALQTELAEVKQADDEELDKLLDQNGTCSGLATCKLPATRQRLFTSLLRRLCLSCASSWAMSCPTCSRLVTHESA
jgi:hypothetical protein